MKSNFFRSASLFVILLTGPITSVALFRFSRPGTSIQYWKKYSSVPFLRFKRVRTEGFCPARRLMHFPPFRVAENWWQLHGSAPMQPRSIIGSGTPVPRVLMGRLLALFKKRLAQECKRDSRRRRLDRLILCGQGLIAGPY